MENFKLFLLVLQLIIAVALIILVLLQKSDGDSLSGIGGSGGLNSVMSSKASANLLSKITMFLIGFFMLNCLVLASLSNSSKKSIQSDLEKVIEQQEKEGSKATPSVPPIK